MVTTPKCPRCRSLKIWPGEIWAFAELSFIPARSKEPWWKPVLRPKIECLNPVVLCLQCGMIFERAVPKHRLKLFKFLERYADDQLKAWLQTATKDMGQWTFQNPFLPSSEKCPCCSNTFRLCGSLRRIYEDTDAFVPAGKPPWWKFQYPPNIDFSGSAEICLECGLVWHQGYPELCFELLEFLEQYGAEDLRNVLRLSHSKTIKPHKL